MRAAVAVLVAAFALAAPPLLGRARADQPLPDRFRLQLQVGATVALSDGSPRVALAGSFGVALGHDRRAFVLLSPEVEFLDATVTRVLVPLGFEYDVPLGAAGPLRFSFFPRISIGYAAIVTADAVAAAAFLGGYAGTGAFWNATTRLLDGFKLLSVPETGINIDAVPGPRGPVTFRDLYLRQYVVTPVPPALSRRPAAGPGQPRLRLPMRSDPAWRGRAPSSASRT